MPFDGERRGSAGMQRFGGGHAAASGAPDRAGAPLIALEDVDITYRTISGDPIRAVAGLSLSVAEGEFYVLVGPSGCGKSTILRLLASLLSPASGRGTIGGEPLPRARSGVAFVFQEATLLPWLTVEQNVLLPCRLGRERRKPRAARAADATLARELLAMVGLQDYGSRYPSELSGGMRQRAGIARALVVKPRLLLMDEPFGALDAMTRESLNAELARIWQITGTTIVFVTHSITEAVFLADRVGVMHGSPGTIVREVAVGAPQPRDLAWMETLAFGQAVGEVRHALFGTGRGGEILE